MTNLARQPLEILPMREPQTLDELRVALGDLAFSAIPGFYVNHAHYAQISGIDGANHEPVIDLIQAGLEQNLGTRFQSDWAELGPDNQSRRGLHADAAPASEHRIRIHRTLAGACSVSLALSSGVENSFWLERDDPIMNAAFDEGFALTDYFQPQIHHVDDVRDNDMIVFASTSPHPAWHKFVTTEAPRTSRVTFLDPDTDD